MKHSAKGNELKNYVNWQINRIVKTKNESIVRADLAKLRKGITKKPGSDPKLWDYTLEKIPEFFLSKTGEPTFAEWAIHNAVTLFALHQQSLPIDRHCMHKEGQTFAEAVAMLIKNESDLKRIKRRFDTVVTAHSLLEMSHHARGLIQLLRREKLPFDYAQFADDLYWYQFPTTRDRVRLKWGQDFFRKYHIKQRKETVEEA